MKTLWKQGTHQRKENSTFHIYFYLLLYLNIARITINNNTPYLKSPKNQNRKAALGRPAMQLLKNTAYGVYYLIITIHSLEGGNIKFLAAKIVVYKLVPYIIPLKSLLNGKNDLKCK